MFRLLLILAAGIITVHPEGNPGARKLTVEEAVGQGVRSVYPERVRIYWDDKSMLTREFPRPATYDFTLPRSEDAEIVYGQSVSRNEFGGGAGVFPSPDGSLFAVYRNDQRDVADYPLYDITTRSGSTRLIKYPMAGTPSEKLALLVCRPDGSVVSELQVNDFDQERYLTNPSWSPDGKYIFVQVVDRAQHRMRLNMYRASTGRLVRTILTESNDAWVEPLEGVHFLKGSYNFLYSTDNRHGYRNLYLCDTLGLIDRVTPCNADVSYLDNDGSYVYYTSAEVSPVENHLFRVRITGKRVGRPERLTSERGWHDISLSPDCTQFIDRYSSVNVPGVTVVKSTEGGRVVNRILEAIDPLDEYAQCKVELGSVKAADGRTDNYYRLFYPLDYDPAKKYPLIVYVYGGPHSQMVTDSWLGGVRMWEMLMAQKGYFVYVQDNRGTSNRGAAFEKAINRQAGIVETEDQMEGIRSLLRRIPAIDRSRIGVHGWSYGGFMTLNLVTRNPGFFKVAVAGGPVIDWKWYEVMYTERYMDNPDTNPEGFAATSLLQFVENLPPHVLICQGVLDNTVVWQHSLNYIQACIAAEKPVDYFPYPMEEHNMRGRARVHLYEKITDYFLTYL